MRVKVPFAAAGSRRDDVYNHKQAIALWFLFNLLDYWLTVTGLSLGARELNPLFADLSLPVFALYKIALVLATVAWLAWWKWLWCLKWVNVLIFIAVIVPNIYDIIVRIVY